MKTKDVPDVRRVIVTVGIDGCPKIGIELHITDEFAAPYVALVEGIKFGDPLPEAVRSCLHHAVFNFFGELHHKPKDPA